MKKYWIILFTIFVTISACSGGWGQTITPTFNEAPSGVYWPTKGWRTSPAQDQGMDADRLAQMLAFIDERQLAIDSVLVIRNGYIITEAYYPPYSQDDLHILYSCTKSFMSALIGIAIEEGAIQGIDQTVVEFFPNKQFQNLNTLKAGMTLEDLLMMQPGLAWVEGWSAYRELDSSQDAISYVLDLKMVETPGTNFNYCTGCSHVLSGIIQETTGMNTQDYAEDRLFEPLGISNFNWQTDRSGLPNGGWGMELTPRDMAKFGYLYLHNGAWDGYQVIPEAWVRDSIGAAEQVEPGVHYGYQWWVYPEHNLFAAQGLGGQKIYVIPDYEMVVVFTADLQNSDIEWTLVEEWILPAVLE